MGQPSKRAAELGEIARVAGRIAVDARKNIVRELKADGSIVTNGDREVETYLRKCLPEFEGGTGFWGEEFGHDGDGPNGMWLVDPVDGTSNYSFGSPLWGTSMALLRGGRIELGAIYLPDLDELYVSEVGQGAFFNDKQIEPIPHGEIQAHELVSFGDRLLRQYPHLSFPGKMRLSGAFVIDGMFTAVQRYRGLIGHRERLYDIAACVGIGLEIDADIRYYDGELFDLVALSQPIQISKPWLIFPKESGYFGKA